jgi:restriction system protein
MSKNVWMIRAGEGGFLIDEFAKGVVAIGWELGDLSQFRSRDELKKAYRQVYPQQKPGKVAAAVAVIYKFCNVIEKGDPVVSYDRGTREYLVGKITSDYYFKIGVIRDYPHLRDVSWEDRVSRDVLTVGTRNSLGSTLSLFSISPEAWEDFEAARSGEKRVVELGEKTEQIDFEQIKRSREDEAHESLKDKLLEFDEYQMQELLATVLRAMGFKTRVSPRGPDRGVDVFASPDGLGLQEPRIKAEVKHRGGAIGAQELRSFIGGLRPGDRALYLSTGGFSKDAKYEADRSNIPLTLIDLDGLAQLVEQQYESFDSDGRGLLPLTKIYWPSE